MVTEIVIGNKNIIETKRLRLTALSPSDYIELVPLFSDPAVMKSSCHGTKSVEEVKSWVAQKVEDNRSGNGVQIFAVKL